MGARAEGREPVSVETVSVWEDEGALGRVVVIALHGMNVPDTPELHTQRW